MSRHNLIFQVLKMIGEWYKIINISKLLTNDDKLIKFYIIILHHDDFFYFPHFRFSRFLSKKIKFSIFRPSNIRFIHCFCVFRAFLFNFNFCYLKMLGESMARMSRMQCVENRDRNDLSVFARSCANGNSDCWIPMPCLVWGAWEQLPRCQNLG